MPVKQHLTATEPARLQFLGPGVFRVQSWKGMAFEMQASTDLEQWSPMTTVTNLTGTLDSVPQTNAKQSAEPQKRPDEKFQSESWRPCMQTHTRFDEMGHRRCFLWTL